MTAAEGSNVSVLSVVAILTLAGFHISMSADNKVAQYKIMML